MDDCCSVNRGKNLMEERKEGDYVKAVSPGLEGGKLTIQIIRFLFSFAGG